MHHLPTYWQSPDGEILSEDKLVDQVLSGAFAGRVLVLDDYKSRGAALPFRHKELKMIQYNNWLTGVIIAICAGDSGRSYLRDLLQSYEYICLPDMELIRGMDSTAELLARAVLETLPKTNIIILGNQLSMLAPYLLSLLEERFVCYKICGINSETI